MIARILRPALAGLLALVLGSAAYAQPVSAPVYKHAGQTNPAIGVFCLDLAGNYTGCGGGAAGQTGSVTAAGTPGTQAQAVQGIPNGVPLTVSGSFLLDTTFTGRINTLGQKTMAGSTPVVIASDQSAVPVSGTVTANLGTLNGAATAANQNVTPAGTTATSAQAVQGVTGGVPQNAAPAQYNPTLPTFASGQTGYLSVDANGRQLLGVSNTVIGGTYGAATSQPNGVGAPIRIPVSAASTNLTQVKATTGRLYKILACNTTTTAARIKFYSALAANVTVGTTALLLTRPIPAASAAGALACVSYDQADIGWTFTPALSFALVTGAADNDTAAVAAGQITDLSIEYQ